MNRIRPAGGPPILPVHQGVVDERAPLLQRTATAISLPEGETSNVEQEARPNSIKPQHTVKLIKRMYENDFSKHTRGHIAGDAVRATATQIASMTKGVATAALTAVTARWILDNFLSKNSESDFYSALFLSHYLANGAMAGANELGRKLSSVANTYMERALVRQYVRSAYKENSKILKGISGYVFGGWRPTLPRRAAMMAKTMRGRENDTKFEYDKSQAGLAFVDKAIDKYLENGKPGDVDAFDNFLNHLRTWELMARVPLSHKVLNLLHKEENGNPSEQLKLNSALEKITAMAPETVRDELSSFMKAWCLSTLPGIPPEKGFIALVGDTELLDGTDLAKTMCKELTGNDPVIVNADYLNEFIDVVVAKEAVPRVKQKTTNPDKILGPFLDWIKSENAACPIVIKNFDFENSKHIRLIENLQKSKKIDIYYDDIKGAKFRVNTQRTRFILCAREPYHGSEMQHPVAHAIIGSPSKDDRVKALGLTLEKFRDKLNSLNEYNELNNLPRITEERMDDIEGLIRQDRYKNLIIEQSMEHNLSYSSMREVIEKISLEILTSPMSMDALKEAADTQQEQPASAEGEAGPSSEAETMTKLEEFIKKCFSDLFPKQVEGKEKKDSKDKKDAKGKDKKDAKGKNVVGTSPQPKAVQLPTIEFDPYLS